MRTTVGAGLLLLATIAVSLGACGSLRLDEWSPRPDASTPEKRAEEQLSDVLPSVRPLEVAWSVNVDAYPAGVRVGARHALVATRRGDLIAIDLATGQRAGRVRLGRALTGAPLAVGDLVVVAVGDGDHSLIAIEPRTGRIRWRRQGPFMEAPPVSLGDGVAAAAVDGSVSAFGLLDGETRWSARPDSAAGFFAAPMISDSLVVVADDRGLVTALRGTDGSIVWRTRLPAPVYTDPARIGDLGFFATTGGILCALRLTDGSAAWCSEDDDPNVRLTGPAAADGVVVVGGTDGRLRSFDAASGNATWTALLPGGMAVPPLISGPQVFAGTLDGTVVAVESTSGEVVWAGDARGRIRTALAATGDGILVGSAPRHITLFRPGSLARR